MASLLLFAFAIPIGAVNTIYQILGWKLMVYIACIIALVLTSVLGGMAAKEVKGKAIAENILPAFFFIFVSAAAIVVMMIFLPQ